MIAEKKDGAISFIGYDTENNGKFIVEKGSLNSDWTYVNYQKDGFTQVIFGYVVKQEGCIFKLDLKSMTGDSNTQCEIVAFDNQFLKSAILNPTDEFYEILEKYFSNYEIKLHYNNTKTIFWSIDGWE